MDIFKINRETIRYCNTSVISVYTSIPKATLNTWRVRGGGPPFTKIGKAVYYNFDDVDNFMATHRKTSTSDNQH